MSERTPLLHYRLSASVNESGEHRDTRTGRDEDEHRSPAAVGRKPAAKQPPKLNIFFGVVIPTLLSMFSVVVFLRIAHRLSEKPLGWLVAVCISVHGSADRLLVVSAVRHETKPPPFLIFIIVIVVLGTIFISFFIVPFRTVQLPGHRNASIGPTSDLKNPSYSIPRGTITAVIFTFVIYSLLSILISCTCDRIHQRIRQFTTTYKMGEYNLKAILLKEANRAQEASRSSFSRITVGNPHTGRITSELADPFGRLRAGTRPPMSAAMKKPDRKACPRALRLCSRERPGRGGAPCKHSQKRLATTHHSKHTSSSGNPWVSVLISWFLVQGDITWKRAGLLAFNIIAAAARSGAGGEEEEEKERWKSLSVRRPTFRYFTWHTCVLGIIGCAIMMFLINAIYASASIAFMLLLLLLIHYLSPVSSWGCIARRLIFHQVRKYLLMLDVRKDHVKFWRPQVLLMVSNPRCSVGLIFFYSFIRINDIKKSGLYVLGNVQLGDLDVLPSDPLQSQYDSWLSLVDHLNIKAFVNLTLADSVRHGVQHLLFISGLGGMRPNTLVLGFYDDTPPQDQLQDSALPICRFSESTAQVDDPENQSDPPFHFPPVRGGVSVGRDGKSLGPQEYVCIIADAVKMLKNVALVRYFDQFDRTQSLQGSVFVDVWPVNLLRPDSAAYVDTCSLFLLQLACILNMTRAWQKAKLRLFLCVEEGRSLKGTEQKLKHLLKDLRMKADICTVPWDSQIALHWQRQTRSGKIEEMESEEDGVEDDKVFVNSFPSNTSRVSDEYLQAVNKLILDQTLRPPAVRFLYLPRPPADTSRYHDYLNQLELLTRNLGPTLLIHGVTPVITTDL
ncbi:LOW QUALITY PROTEIN: solute carrier family 12 member 9-like [Cyprinus carpio]|uniref:LOW QUALITY PROTEIN: solute carrier family 12 member 9-like n=1 Tax=Cyprinus carpio TaxID=7962 RepID=A0A9Q9YWI0_CYPCA|nr:LOW QUALITY PROTEIN: solute carrier family 12 member 9-like [Cyprinus carpio]